MRVVDAPKDFSKAEKALWNECQGQLRSQDTWVDTDRHILERYVRAVFRAALAAKAAKAAPWVEGDRGYGLKAHPGFAVARAAETDARKDEETLLLGPRYRKQHDVKTGEALADVIDFPDFSGDAA